MSSREPRTTVVDAVLEFLGTPRFSAALSITIVGTAFFSYLLRNVIGAAGLFAVLAGLIVFAALSLVGQRETLEWRGFLPFSLLVFLGWTALSVFFSDYQWTTLGAIVYQLAFTVLAVYIALARDFIQIVRAVGDALRGVLLVSLVLELVVGVLLDTRFPLLSIAGNMAEGGPIQGVMGSRNALGLVALLALVTFGTEVLTQSISRRRGIASLAMAALTILLSQSPVNLSVVVILGIASLGLLGLRRVPPETRRYALWALGGVAVAVLVIAYTFRSRILAFLGATGDLNYRLSLWNHLFPFIQLHTLEGWGWVGTWPSEMIPFADVDPPVDHASALNAYLDVWFQVGLIGLFAFLIFVGLAVVRAWVLATQKRSRVFVWPALILVAMLVTSAMESGALVEWGWLVIVVCAVKVAQHLSWRRPLQA